MLIAVILLLVVGLLLLVAWSKVRRDRTEEASALLRAQITATWNSGDPDQLAQVFEGVRAGHGRHQTDLLAALRTCEANTCPDAAGFAAARAAFEASRLRDDLLAQLNSRIAVRRGIAASLGGLQSTHLPSESLAPLLTDRDATVRLAAAGALEAHASASAAAYLAQALTAGLMDAPRVVERLGHPWAVPHILTVLPGEEPASQAQFVDALRLARDPRALPDLTALADSSPDPEVRLRCARAIVACLDQDDDNMRRLAAEFARHHVRDPQAVVRASAMDILGTDGGEGDLALIAMGLHDHDWFVRRTAARALIAAGPDGISRLRVISMSDDEFAAVRARQELALAGLADARVVEG